MDKTEFFKHVYDCVLAVMRGEKSAEYKDNDGRFYFFNDNEWLYFRMQLGSYGTASHFSLSDFNDLAPEQATDRIVSALIATSSRDQHEIDDLLLKVLGTTDFQ